MGLFGAIGKVLGKVGKIGVAVAGSGINALTHGAAKQVLKVLKGRGGGTAAALPTAQPGRPLTAQEQALLSKVAAPVARVKRTEYAGEGWAFGGGAKRSRAMGKARPRTRAAAVPVAQMVQADTPRRTAKAPRSPAKPRSGNGKGSTRPPKKSQRVYAAWKAAGKPGDFFSWSKAHRKEVA